MENIDLKTEKWLNSELIKLTINERTYNLTYDLGRRGDPIGAVHLPGRKRIQATALSHLALVNNWDLVFPRPWATRTMDIYGV